jgi:hypothetical protein
MDAPHFLFIWFYNHLRIINDSVGGDTKGIDMGRLGPVQQEGCLIIAVDYHKPTFPQFIHILNLYIPIDF